MFKKRNYYQLFVEYENRDVHVDIHLHKFDEKNAQAVFMDYIEKYRDKEINQLFVRFWNRCIAGDYLSFMRKNDSESFLVQPLSGFKYIKGMYDYVKTSADIGDISVIV